MKNKLQFGTDGIRGKSADFPFTSQALWTLGSAIAFWSLEKYNKKAPTILIGHDTRHSCNKIKESLITGLCEKSLSITDGGVLPTPAILHIIQHKKTFDCGIVISASHNPYTDNGIKLFDAKTGKLSHKDEAIIVTHFENLQKEQPSPSPIIEKNSAKLWPKASNVYINNIISFFPQNFLEKKTIVLDCANGATYQTAPEIFTRLGATVIPTSITPTGKNINENCGALHPSFVQQKVKEYKADIGFAFDGDGDRVIGVNKEGIIKDGDDFLALLLTHSDFSKEEKVVGTVMTNHGFAQHIKKQNKNLIRTKVGDKYVAAQLDQNQLLLGGEASGHIIIKTYLNSGDGIFVALKILEAIIATNNWEMETFTKTPQILLNVEVSHKKDLEQAPYKKIIETQHNKLQDGRIVVRYSGTENLLRIMVEDKTFNSAKMIANTLSNQLQFALNNK